MRSLLFVPGDSDKKLAKAMAADGLARPDALIIDIEDSVAPSEKPKARAMTAAFIRANRGQAVRPRFYVRINALDTGYWRDDVAAVVPAGPEGVFLPKPRSGADVAALSRELESAERAAGLPVGQTRIIAIVTEVPISLLKLDSYIGVSPRLEVITWGAEDLSAAMGSLGNRDASGAYTSPFRLARDLCLFTACAAGVQPLDTIYGNYRDEKALEAECLAAARDGFTGKMAIHPAQVAIINRAFTPSAEEIALSRRIIAAFDGHPGVGVVGLDGEMLDQPHLTRARRVLQRAKAAGAS